MDHVVPQDEYFEWEDIVAYQNVQEDKDENLLLQLESLASCSRTIDSVGGCDIPVIQHTEVERTKMGTSTSLYSVRASLTFDTGFSPETKSSSSPINFPSYAEFSGKESSFLIENFAAEAGNLEELPETMDDIAICPGPLRHVDYLSHDWREEDIWATWKRLASKRRAHNMTQRLENASWRAWSKVRLNVKTVDPETFNWMKDLDDTWLYGPFHGDASSITTFIANNSDDTHKFRTTLSVKKTRSILKRPRLSEVLLRGSEQISTSRSKSVELNSRPFFSDTAKKRVEFREDVEQYAAVQTTHVDNNDYQDEFDHWTKTYQSKFQYGESYDDPVEDLLSTAQSLKHHVEQNIKMLENCHRQNTVEKLDPVPLKTPKNSSGLDSSNDDRGKIANSVNRCYNEPLRFSTLSEWTMLGEGFDDEEEDWLEPSPYTIWKPTIESAITSQMPTKSTSNAHKRSSAQINIDDQMKEELTALMRCEELYLDPSSSDTSESHSSGSEDVEHDNLAYVSIQDFPEERSEVREIRNAPTFQEMKQAFVDRVMEDFYMCEKDDGSQDFNSLIPPDLIHPALKAAGMDLGR